MTKEELEKEAGESWWNDNNCSGALSTKKIYICGFLAGAEPREKRIAELEELLNSTLEENKEIYKKMADLDTALEDCTESLTDARIKIKELEKENTELKDKLKNLESVAEVRLANWQKYEKENTELKKKIENLQKYLDTRNCYRECAETWEKLTKAKKIIGNLYAICKDNHYPNTSVLMEQAAQFLKEREYKMTVAELHKELSLLIEQGHADTRVTANINFKSPWDIKKGEEVGDFWLGYLDWVYYQSGDIELRFSDTKIKEDK